MKIQKKDNVSIVIPCYKEENTLPSTVADVLEWISNKNIDAEVILVAEKSPDKTQSIALALEKKHNQVTCIINKKRLGKGLSIQKGIKTAKKDLILITDADMSVPIIEASKMIKKIKEDEVDVVIGKRVQIISQPFYRIVMGKIYSTCVSKILNIQFADTQCGFKLLKKQCAKDVFPMLPLKGRGFSVDTEFLAFALALGYKVADIKVPWKNNQDSTVNPLIDSIDMFIQLINTRKAVNYLKKNNARKTQKSDCVY